MVDPGALTGSIEAATTVGLVLVEAVVLYVVYGAVTRLASSRVQRALGDE